MLAEVLLRIVELALVLSPQPGQEAAPPPGDSGVEVVVQARALWASVWGSASAHNDFTRYVRGEGLDLRDDFNLTHPAPLFTAGAWVRFEDRHRIGLRGFFGEISSTTTLERSFEYNDNVFQAGEEAQTSLEIDLREAEYAYRILKDEDQELWLGGGFRWARFNVGLSSTTLDPQGSMEDNKALYATLNAGFALRVSEPLSVLLELRGSPVALPIGFHRPSRGRFVEAHASIAWKPHPSVTLDAGVDLFWTWQDCKAREPDLHYAVNRVEILLLGPSIGLSISF